ncbi:hypothetical protein ACH4VR_36200 [Streptomyces sp. NPDC020883]|uniref:hypothetical protein n=1 Tax=Streptomyces sp. NPDC020883 TaxID=3365099 RepID=UPI0037AAE241
MAAGLLGGCSGDQVARRKPGAEDSRGGSASVAPLTLPAGYDGSRGWDTVLNWVPSKVSTLPVTVGGSGVGVLQAASGGYLAQYKDASSGTVRWTAKPWNPPPTVADASEDDGAADIPGVVSVRQQGREYLVAWAHGMAGKDDLHEGREVVQLEVYAADAKGSGVAPVREVSVPVDVGTGSLHVDGGDGGVLVSWGGQGLYGTSAAVADVVSGKITSYRDVDGLLPECGRNVGCSGSTIVAADTGGPLVSMGGGGFGVPGRWVSTSVTPAGVEARTGFLQTPNGKAQGVTGTHVLAAWQTGDSGDGIPVWAVHALNSGQVQATQRCGAKEAASSTGRMYPVVSSPNGRYLAAGPIAFDMSTKRGVCLQGDGDRKTVNLASIDDDGVAYGAVEEPISTSQETGVVAQVDLKSGHTTVLKAGTDVPVLHVGSNGVIVRRDKAGHLEISVRPRH